MKNLATIVLSIIGIVASLLFILMGVCSFIGGHGIYIVLGLVFLALGIAALIAVLKLIRTPSE